MDSLNQKIDHLPTNPGVYLFKDKKGTILYVGKAGNIKHRVSSYFQKTSGKGCEDPRDAGKGGGHRYHRHRYGKGSLHSGEQPHQSSPSPI